MSTMKFYKSYNFKDKDPVIDKLRTALKSSGYSYQEVHEMSGVAKATLYNWFDGDTRRPQYATIMAFTRAIGFDWKLVPVRPKR